MRNKHLILIILASILAVNVYAGGYTAQAELPSEAYGKSIGIGNELSSLSDSPNSPAAAPSRSWRPDPEEGDESGGGENAPGGPVGDGFFILLALLSAYFIFQQKRLSARQTKKNC